MRNPGKVLLAFEDAVDGGRYFFNSKTPGRSFYENVLGKVICSQTVRYKKLQNKRVYGKGKRKECYLQISFPYNSGKDKGDEV